MFGPFVMPQAVNAKKADFTPHYKFKANTSKIS